MNCQWIDAQCLACFQRWVRKQFLVTINKCTLHVLSDTNIRIDVIMKNTWLSWLIALSLASQPIRACIISQIFYNYLWWWLGSPQLAWQADNDDDDMGPIRPRRRGTPKNDSNDDGDFDGEWL